jgi:hypothetical protein
MSLKFLKLASFFTFPFLIFCLALFFYFSGIYSLFTWLDIPLHFIGGASIAYMALLFFRFWKQEKKIEIKNRFILVLLVVCVVALFAVVWELGEFFCGDILRISFFAQESLEDTLLDLFVGLCGGLTGGIFSKV